MKDLIKEVRRKIPKGCEIPSRFDDFVRAELPFEIAWTKLEDSFCLKASARKEAVPFLHLGDGSYLAFWFHAPSPAIVLFGSEGERRVVAEDFDNFLKGLNSRVTGVPGLDEEEEPFRVPGVKGKSEKAGLKSLQTKFDEWFKKHTSRCEPTDSPAGDAVRQRIFEIAKAMIRDGRSKIYDKMSSDWDSMDFRIERTETGFSITYLDFGKWYPLQKQYKLAAELPELLSLVKHKERDHYELSASIDGLVTVDQGRELSLLPPDYDELAE